MKKVTKITGIIALVAVIGFGFVSCDTPEEKAAKAAQKAADNLLKTLGGTDAAAIQEALTAAGQAGLAALTSTSANPGGDFSYAPSKDGKYVWINKYSGNGGLVIVPAEIEGLPVIGINASAFSGGYTHQILDFNYGGFRDDYVESNGGENITAVVLPDSLKYIYSNAFRACANLHTINIPAGLQSIGRSAFDGCENLYNFTIPESVTALKIDGAGERTGTIFTGFTVMTATDAAFAGCQKLLIATRSRINDLAQAWITANPKEEE